MDSIRVTYKVNNLPIYKLLVTFPAMWKSKCVVYIPALTPEIEGNNLHYQTNI